jgi:hypothetical protein
MVMLKVINIVLKLLINIRKTFYFESKESFNAFKKALMRN